MVKLSCFSRDEIDQMIERYKIAKASLASALETDGEPNLEAKYLEALESLKSLEGSGPEISKANPDYVRYLVEERQCYVGEVGDGQGTLMIDGHWDPDEWIPNFVSRPDQDEHLKELKENELW